MLKSEPLTERVTAQFLVQMQAALLRSKTIGEGCCSLDCMYSLAEYSTAWQQINAGGFRSRKPPWKSRRRMLQVRGALGRAAGAPADDSGNVLRGFPFAKLDGVRPQIDGMAAQLVEPLQD